MEKWPSNFGVIAVNPRFLDPTPRAFHPDSMPPLRGKISESCHARTIANLMRISVTSKNGYPTTVTINAICKKKRERLCKVTSVILQLFRLDHQENPPQDFLPSNAKVMLRGFSRSTANRSSVKSHNEIWAARLPPAGFF